MLRNALRYVVLDKLTDFLLFLGKLVITGGMGAAAYYYFAGGYNFNEFLVGHLNYYFVPIIVSTVHLVWRWRVACGDWDCSV